MNKSLALCVEEIGGGDFEKGKSLIENLAQRLHEARVKHPVFSKTSQGAFEVINEEVGELMAEIYLPDDSLDEERQLDEAYDVLATVCRFINGEHKGVENGN